MPVVSSSAVQMLFIQRDDVVKGLSTTAPYPPLGDPILPRRSNSDSFRFRPVLFRNEITSMLNLESRSRMA